jgi:hypothetical protein
MQLDTTMYRVYNWGWLRRARKGLPAYSCHAATD